MRNLTFKERYDIYVVAKRKSDLIINILFGTLTLIITCFGTVYFGIFDDSRGVAKLKIFAIFIAAYLVSGIIIYPFRRCLLKLKYKSIKQKYY